MQLLQMRMCRQMLGLIGSTIKSGCVDGRADDIVPFPFSPFPWLKRENAAWEGDIYRYCSFFGISFMASSD